MEIEYFDYADWEEHFETLLTRYAAGVGPDIIPYDIRHNKPALLVPVFAIETNED